MPLISSDSFQTSVRHNKIDPVYFLFGEEDLLIEEGLELLVEKAVDPSTRSFNYDLLHGSETTWPDLVERVSAYPLMAERRVVVVKDIDRLVAMRGKLDTNAPFLRYLEAPASTTVLVMTAPTGDFMTKGKAKAPFNTFIDRATSVQYKKIYDRELPSWTSDRIKSRGKEITPEAVELFVGYSGSSLRVINNEIEKLFTFVEDRKRITVEDVRSVVGTSKLYNVFELQKAIGARNLELSVEISERMLRAGEPEQLILTMLSRYFTILWRLVELRSTSRDRTEMARAVGISPFFLDEYLGALGRYPLAHLQNAFEALLNADVTLKTSNTPVATVMQMMLVGIIRGESLVAVR